MGEDARLTDGKAFATWVAERVLQAVRDGRITADRWEVQAADRPTDSRTGIWWTFYELETGGLRLRLRHLSEASETLFAYKLIVFGGPDGDVRLGVASSDEENSVVGGLVTEVHRQIGERAVELRGRAVAELERDLS